jgi:hypothetical protein
MGRKLFIYDTADEDNLEQAVVRFRPYEVEWLGAGTKDQLLVQLDNLVKRRLTFERVLVQTHGHPGVLKFGSDDIWSWILERDFAPRGYHRLFPQFTKIYFDGCNVGAGSQGDAFLNAVGATFFGIGGGQALAWTSAGYWSSWLPFIGDHTIHYSGDLKRFVFMAAGGRGLRVM